MAQLLQAFNAQQYDPTQGAGQLPVGKHPVKIIDSEVKANKAGDGGYLQLTLQIIDGPQTGATGPYRLNLYHQNQQTVEIAHKQLSAICHVIGVFNIQDSQQLHNVPFVAEVGFQKGDEQKYTEVKKVFDINGNEPGKTGQPAQNAAPANGFAQQNQPPVQQQQQPPQNQTPAWGGGQQAAPQQHNQPSGAPAWGNQPAQNAAPQGQNGGWGGAQGGSAPWAGGQS